MQRIHKPSAFTLVELLVVITIIGVLVAVLLPAIGKARVTAITAVCAANMHQHAIYQAAYFADCRDAVPMPGSPHNCAQSNPIGMQVGAYTNGIALISPSGVACADAPGGVGPRMWPTGFGWYYVMGYIKPHVPWAKLGILDCPGAPNYAWFPSTLAQVRVNDFNIVTPLLATQTYTAGTNPQGSGTDCQPVGPTGYALRGWLKSGTVSANNQGKYGRNWSPDNAVEVCYEWYSGWSPANPDNGMSGCHEDGLNIGFFDGHVKFGGKNIAGYVPFVYYGMTINGYSFSQASGLAGTPACSSWVYGGWSAEDRLWNYYETNTP